MRLDDIAFSEYGRASGEPAPVNRMMAAFAEDFRDDCDINLGVGYVNEHTIPQDAVREALDHVLSHPGKYRQALNYGGPSGSPNLVESIRAWHRAPHGGSVPDDVLGRNAVIIGPNGVTSILEGLANIIEPGIVITSDPMYYIYCDFLQRKGFELVTVPEDEDGIVPEAVNAVIDKLGSRRQGIRFIYVVTVSNPSCTILTNARRRALTAIAHTLSDELGRKVPLIFDKAYESLIHDPGVEAPESALTYDEFGLVYELGTLSKLFAPALRIGYMMGPEGPFVKAMVQRTSDVGFSAPLVTQEIASYLLDEYGAAQQERVNAGYREKARRVGAAIERELGPHVATSTGGRAGFYFYLTLEALQTGQDSDFFRFLARTTGDAAVDGPPDGRAPRVVYIPGDICVNPQGSMMEAGQRQLRISYGFEETGRIEEALGYMREAAEYAG